MKVFVIFHFFWISISFVSTLNELERKEFLDVHNFLRRAVVPSAADMQELEYDENIERNVTEFLKLCIFEHQGKGGFGENGRLSTDSNITNSVVSWFQERIYFNISTGTNKRCSKDNTNIDYLPEAQCGHYKIMVKSTLKRIGCDYKFCKNIIGKTKNYTTSFLTFCFYDTGQRDQPYEIGERCSGCDRSYKFCYNELCVPKNKYDKKVVSCKVICQNCAPFFTSCLCDCPPGTEENTCRGNLNITNCPLCQKNGQACVNGYDISKNGVCICKCKENYQGKYCEILSNQFAASYYYVIDGLSWRHGLHLPVNLLEFKNSYFQLQRLIFNDVLRFCEQNKLNENCKEISGTILYPNNIHLIEGFPFMFENGSLAFRIFFNYTDSNKQIKEEKFISPMIFENILNYPSKDLAEYFANVKSIYPREYYLSTTPEYYLSTTSAGFQDKLIMKIENIFACTLILLVLH